MLLENNGPFENLPEAELNDRNGDEQILLEKPDEKPAEGHWVKYGKWMDKAVR